ncbi:MAG: hypothetical protein WAT66_13585 [Actinomycetota bacterium]
MIKKVPLRRGIAALALAAAIVPLGAGTAGAVSPLPVACNAAGTVIFTNSNATDHWTIAGRGSCLGDLEGTYFLDFTGTGTSSSLGLCDQGLVVLDLHINVIGTLTNAQTLQTKLINQDWVAPITTYPLGTPFLINQNATGSLIGAGSFFNHIFLNCSGPSVAWFEFGFLT